MTRQIEFRLIGHDGADGELLAADALLLIGAFRELAYRLTRAVAEGPGLGRAKAVIERISTVHVALRTGSTRVVFVLGDDKALLDPLAEAVDDAFASIVDGMAANRRPSSLAEPVADAVDGLVVALTKAAPRVEVSIAGTTTTRLVTAELSRVPWQRRGADPSGEATVHGTLEMVDLHSARFRVRDAAGSSIDLVDVHEPEEAARLVGAQVTARGLLSVGTGTQHHRLADARVSAGPAWELPTTGTLSLEEVLPQVGASPPPALDLTDDELEDLLDAARAG